MKSYIREFISGRIIRKGHKSIILERGYPPHTFTIEIPYDVIDFLNEKPEKPKVDDRQLKLFGEEFESKHLPEIENIDGVWVDKKWYDENLDLILSGQKEDIKSI